MDKQELLKKLKALAEHGVGGEKINAQKLLDKLMRKYGVSDTDLNDDVVLKFEKKIRSQYDKKLLMQVVYKVTNKTDNMWSYKGYRTLIEYACTKAQNIEIEFLFDFYKRLLEKETKFLFDAFVQKHKIFGTSVAPSDDENLSAEELARLLQMMDALSNEQPQLQIEAPKG